MGFNRPSAAYDDHREWTVRAYTDKPTAELHAKAALSESKKTYKRKLEFINSHTDATSEFKGKNKYDKKGYIGFDNRYYIETTMLEGEINEK